MCHFVSWIEKNRNVLFLTGDDVFHTTRGKKLQKWCGCSEDLIGHGAIRWYFECKNGYEYECFDFSTPKNFPKEIVKAIKSGKMRGLAAPDKLLLKGVRDKLLTKINKTRQKNVQQALNRISKNKEARYDPNKNYGGKHPFNHFIWDETQEGFKFWKNNNKNEKSFEISMDAFWDAFAIKKNRPKVWR